MREIRRNRHLNFHKNGWHTSALYPFRTLALVHRAWFLKEQDVSGDFQDLDDLLADALQGDDHDTHGVTQKAPLNLDSPQLNQTLDGLEAAATAEIAKNASGAAAISEEAGLEADALEAFLQGGSRRDRREGGVEVAATGRRPVKEPFGDDEERLLQMVCCIYR